jgi:hypothetical protein
MVTPVPGATVICPLPCDKLVGAPTHPDTLRLYTGPTLWQNNVTLRTSLSIARPRLEPRKTDKQPDQETPKVCKEGVSLTTVFDVATRECRSR